MEPPKAAGRPGIAAIYVDGGRRHHLNTLKDRLLIEDRSNVEELANTFRVGRSTGHRGEHQQVCTVSPEVMPLGQVAIAQPLTGIQDRYFSQQAVKLDERVRPA